MADTKSNEKAKVVKTIKPQNGFQEKFVRSNVDVAFGGGIQGCGKCLYINELVCTPFGFRRIGDIKVGDTITGSNGRMQKVIGVYPQGLKDVYKLTFADGCYSLCSEDHLWTVRKNTENDNYWKLYTTEDIINSITLDNEQLYIPRCKPVEFFNSNITGRDCAYSIGVKLSNSKDCLQTIPINYLYCSAEERSELLSGILGFRKKEKNGITSYKTKSEQFATDLQFLVRSLGGNAKVIKSNDSFCVEIEYNSLQKYSEDYTYEATKKIESCEFVGKEECICIKVSNPDGLFLTNDFIVTHNTFASCLLPAEWLRIGAFRACYTRRNLGDTKTGGGMVDEFRNIYGSEVSVKESDNPRVVYNTTGAWIDFTHISDENIKKLSERIKGWQYDLLYMDEITSYLEFSTFMIFATRVRGKAGIGSKIRGTTNPKRNHWIRKFIDWYIDENGYIDPERDGVVRYFYIAGETVDDVVWGNSKKEVYDICSGVIDKQIEALRGNAKYEDFIKSFVFYRGYLDENQELIGGNSGYVGNIAMAGGKKSKVYLEGNWNIDEDEDLDDSTIISINEAQSVFKNEPQTNNDWWITIDLAGVGKDNTMAIVWNGLHIMDVAILTTSTPIENATRAKTLAEKWNIPFSRIIFDATNGMYFRDYLPASKAFTSRNTSRGLFRTTYPTMKDECAYRLVELIKNGRISFEKEVADRQYKHKKINSYIRIGTEFIQECNAIRFNEANSGKRSLYTKVEMNKILGRGRSMDFIDPCIMRMMPIVRMPLGEELIVDRLTTNDYGANYNINNGAFGSWI